MNSSSTANQVVLSSDSTTDDRVSITGTVKAKRKSAEKNLVNAVYAHITAVRALGRKTINTQEIADALNLPMATVERSILLLKKKGVKFLNAA
jgi:predicted transcriptional regulator